MKRNASRILLVLAGCVLVAFVAVGYDKIGIGEKTAVLVEGTTLQGTLQNRLSSEKNSAGDAFAVRVTQPIPLEKGETIPSGAVIHGELTEVKPTDDGKKAALTLEFRELELPNGDQAPIDAEPIRIVAKESGAEDKAEKIAIGGIAGAVIGGLAGGAKGAMTGTLAGIGAGTVVALATENGVLTLEPGTQVAVQIREDAKVPLSS
jgi:hypothetical protein